MRNRAIVVSVILFALHITGIASVVSEDISIFRILNTGEGNLCITQDKDGLVLVGTEGEGLLCYDGKKIRKIKLVENKNFFQIIPSILVDKEGIIWFIVADHGLRSYDKRKNLYKEYESKAGDPYVLVSNHVNVCSCSNLAEDKEGLIWIGTADGLSSYNKITRKFTQYKHNPGDNNSLSNNNVWAVFVDRQGLVWIGTENGLNCYDKSSNKFSCYKHDSSKSNCISNSYVRAIAEDKIGNIWIGTKSSGIDKFDKKTGTFTNYRRTSHKTNSLSYNQIHRLMVDRRNNLWICNDGNVGIDLYDIDKNLFAHYSYDPENPNTISSNNRLCSFEDSSGIVWLTDNSGGLNKCIWQKNVFKNYTHNPKDSSSIGSNDLAKIYEDKSGNIWIGIYRGGMCLYTKDDKFENFIHDTNPFSLPGVTVHSILDASDQNIWIGVSEGFVSLFNTETKRVIKRLENPYLKITPCYLTKDNKNPGILWFACSYAEGVFKVNTSTGEFTAYKHDPYKSSSISQENTFSMFQDGDILWLGTGGSGLCKFDKNTGTCVYYRHDPKDKNSISGDVVIESYIDRKGNFWVTTDDGGLNLFDKQTGKFLHDNFSWGFPSNSARHILEDSRGHLWIGTDYGIVKFDPEQLKVTRWFTTVDGLMSNDFDCVCNPIKDSKGNFWFSTFKGICKFDPEEVSKIEPNIHTPSVILSSFRSEQKSYNENSIRKINDINLDWPYNSFEFTFAVLDYMDPANNQHAYKLEGFDKDWNYIGTNNSGRYTNILPGEYVLKLAGSNNHGIWNTSYDDVRITIKPPFWMTSWFKGIALLSVILVAGFVVQLRIRSLKKKALFMREHAAQVAHDIRSPLAALNTALKDLKELPEQKRILIRNATRRISDIANNLLIKYKVKESESVFHDGKEKKIKAELVSSLLDSLVSEKRIQIVEKSVDLILELGESTHSCFVNLDPEKFKRIISNLVNNSTEAIETKGVIQVILTKKDHSLIIEIIDNGKGISEDILLKLKQGRVISSKREGFGLGIPSAIKSIKSWHGSYKIESVQGKGTNFTIRLPIAEEPEWFQNAIVVSPNKHIIILDDDESIHNIWQSHFPEYVKDSLITLEHFYDSLSFAEYCNKTCSKNDLFLVDYELVNSKENGLDLIERFDLSQQAILVTSRYEEIEIKERIKKLGIKIIPKSFAPYIPISMINVNTQNAQPELIFIDDDKTLTEAWKIQASLVGKKIATFNSSADFMKIMESCNKNVPIYIDSDLKEQIPGEFFAKFLYQKGFNNLYLATGYEKNKFGRLPWIREIVSKESPF